MRFFINKDIIAGCDGIWDNENSVPEFNTDQVDENFPTVDENDSGVTMVVESSENHYSIQQLFNVLGDEVAQFGNGCTSFSMIGCSNLSASIVLRGREFKLKPKRKLSTQTQTLKN